MKFDEYFNWLFEEEYRKESDSYIVHSIDYEMYLQKVTKIHYLHSMRHDVMSELKVYFGINNIV